MSHQSKSAQNRTRTRQIGKKVLPLMTAISIGISGLPLAAYADPGQTNSVNVGPIVQGGEYYNTADSQTTFTNPGGGLWIQAGNIVRGLEVDYSNQLTGNGGNLLFHAPDGIVRVDGGIDVSGLLGRGYATANGGNVTVNAAYLFQNGNIYANGVNGGSIVFNVGAATFSPTSNTTAMGIGGAGGSIAVNSSGVVDIQNGTYDENVLRGAILDASGQYIGHINTSLISIEGSVVNIDGVVRANGYVVADGNVVHLYNEQIAGPAGSDGADGYVLPKILRPNEGTLMTTGSRGGTILIASTGGSSACVADCAISKAADTQIDIGEGSTTSIFTAEEAAQHQERLNSLASNYDGDIVIGARGQVLADGSDVKLTPSILGHRHPSKGYGYYDALLGNHEYEDNTGIFDVAGDGGTIILNARRDVNVLNDGFNGGLLSARGGNGNGDTYRYIEWVRINRFISLPVLRTAHNTFNAGDGGTISLNAMDDINFGGSAHAFGGTGYQNYRGLNAGESGLLNSLGKNTPQNYQWDNQDNAVGGLGGDGGLIAFSYGDEFNNDIVDSLNGFSYDPSQPDGTKSFVNYSQIDASGGHSGKHGDTGLTAPGNPWGGLVVFSGEKNPDDISNVSVYRGQADDGSLFVDFTRFGTVVLPQPNKASSLAQLTTGNTNFKPAYTSLNVEKLRNDELLSNGDTLILLSRSNRDTLAKKFNNAIVRTADHEYQAGGAGEVLDGTIGDIRNLVISSTVGNELTLNKPNNLENGDYQLSYEGEGFNLNSLSVLNSAVEGSSTLINNQNTTWAVGGPGKLGGGHIVAMSDGDLLNHGALIVGGQYNAGSIALASGGTIYNNGLINASFGNAGNGSIILKAKRNIVNDGYWAFSGSEYNPDFEYEEEIPSFEGDEFFYDQKIVFDGPYFEGGSGWRQVDGGRIRANGEQNGGRIEMFAGNNIFNMGTITANVKNNSQQSQDVRVLDFDYDGGDYNEGILGNNHFGGTILGFAGNNNINFGRYAANANVSNEGGYAQGGYIRLHGNNLAVNVDVTTLADPSLFADEYYSYQEGPYTYTSFGSTFGPGQIRARATNQGGQVYLTAGQSCGFGGCAESEPTSGTDGFNEDVDTAMGILDESSSLLIPGFGTNQNTPPVTVVNLALDLKTPGSALNLGHINTNSKQKGGGGTTWLIGNGQVGLGDGSSINGVKVDYAGILGAADPTAAFQDMQVKMNKNGNQVNLLAGLVDGIPALEAALCADLPGLDEPAGPNPGGNAAGVRFPQNFTLPGGTTIDDALGFDVNALYQEYRFRSNNEAPKAPALLILGFEQPNMFLAQAYAPVTDEILALALKEYNRVLADGEVDSRALQIAQAYLEEAGVDADVAKALLEKIADGTFTADPKVVQVLQAMAGQPETPQGQPEDTLRQ